MYINKVEKFLVEATLLDRTNDTTVDISSFIKSVNIKKDYLRNSFPLFVIDIMTTEQVRDIMRDNDIAVNLKIDKYIDTDNEFSEDSTEQPVIDERIISTTIRIYDKPYASSSTYKEDDDENSDSISETMKVMPYQLVGIPEELIEKNNTLINQIYEDTKLNDVIINILSQVEKKEIFLDDSDNTERESSLLIPPYNIVTAIKYLQSTYGIYNSPIGIFFDLDKTSVYKMFNADRQYANTFEVITVDVNDIGDDNKFTTPMVDEDSNIRLYLKNTPAFISNLKVNSDVLGETTVFNSYDYDHNLIKRVYNNDEPNGKTRYFWNTLQDKLFEEMFITSNFQYSEGIGIPLSNIDPSYFGIDTLYKLSTDTEYANGNYELIENSFSIYTDDYEHYNSMMYLKLSKIK